MSIGAALRLALCCEICRSPSLESLLPFIMTQAQVQADYGAKESTSSQAEDVKHEVTHKIAERGHAATDM